jgi:hypothetical protein
MYAKSLRHQALSLHDEGLTTAAISRRLAISREALARWFANPENALENRPGCFVCERAVCPDPINYLYLLGQYLGDGCLTVLARVTRLRIACADSYPGISHEVDTAMIAMSENRVQVTQAQGCAEHSTYWKHWPCLFRSMALAESTSGRSCSQIGSGT